MPIQLTAFKIDSKHSPNIVYTLCANNEQRTLHNGQLCVFYRLFMVRSMLPTVVSVVLLSVVPFHIDLHQFAA